MRGAAPAGLLARKTNATPKGLAAARPARARPPGDELATPVLKARRSPTRSHGKVFFSAGADNYECSGTAVRARSKSLVLTAAHCAYLNYLLPGNGNAVGNWIFVPAYDNGRAPFGKWAASSLAAPAGWINSQPVISSSGEITGGDSRFDLGGVTVFRNGGQSLQANVGGRRVGFRRPRRHRYTIFGYPAEHPFGGQREFSCSSRYHGADAVFGSPPPIRVTCDMTAGASGGGWIDRKGRLVSVTSYSYSNDARSLYGPYFGTTLRDFYGSVSAG
jgi:V8-like Glu-specific endopeptidase